MKIISTTNHSYPGNDCYIEEEYSLVEQFGLYAVIKFYKVTGWSDREEVSILVSTSDKSEAGRKYRECCKYFKS